MSQAPSDALQELRALSDLISRSVDDIQKFCTAKKEAFPSPDEPFSLSSEAVRLSPELVDPTRTLVAAASQLISAVRSSPANLLTAALQVPFLG